MNPVNSAALAVVGPVRDDVAINSVSTPHWITITQHPAGLYCVFETHRHKDRGAD